MALADQRAALADLKAAIEAGRQLLADLTRRP